MRLSLVLYLFLFVGPHVWAAETPLHVVIGSFATEAAAERARKVSSYSRELLVVPARIESGQVNWRLVSGPFNSYAEARREREQLRQLGVESAWIASAETSLVATAPEDAAPEPQPETRGKAAPVFRDVIGEQTLVKRGIPQDLNRGVLVRVTPESLARYMEERDDTDGKMLPAMELPSAQRVSQMQEIYLSEVRLRGSDLMASELKSIFEPYLDRSITTEELLELKNRANQMFVTNGYINSGVLIPDQQVVDGVIVLDTIEGSVNRIDVSGRLRSSYVSSRLDTEQPFNLHDLQTSLKLLEKDPLVETVKARILPGDRLGTATVDIEVDAAKFYRVGLTGSNNRAPSVGAEHGELYFGADNLLGFGDSLFLSGSVTEGLDAYAFEYAIPFNSRDHTFLLSYSRTDAAAVEEPFNAIDIDSVTESLRVGLIFPVRRTPNSELAVEVIAEARRNLTSLLGVPFSFSEGAINGESRVAPVRVGATYVRQGLSQSIAGRLVVSRGTTAYDATEQVSGPDGEFTSVLGQLQYSRQLTGNFHMTAKMLFQYTADPLLAIERVSIGGFDTVRGYRENQLVRDNAYLVSVEGRYRLPAVPQVQFVTFADWGSGENDDESVGDGSDDLSSVGVGIDVRALRGFSASLYFAHGFKDFTFPTSDLQDDGIHFMLNYEYRF